MVDPDTLQPIIKTVVSDFNPLSPKSVQSQFSPNNIII